MEVTQFTYFQQVGGFDCNPVSGEITYGLERLAMYVQGVDRVFDLNFNGRTDARKLTYGDVFLQAEQEYSRFNFEHADTDMLLAALPRRGEGVQGAALEAAPSDALREPAGRRERQAPQAGAAGLRPVHQGLPHLQPAGRPRRDLRDRAAELHPARARSRQGLLRGVAADRGGRGVSIEGCRVTNLMSERARRMRREKGAAERKLWYRLREFNRHGFQFRQQAPVGPYIADFCDHSAKLIIEVDGAQHGEPKGLAVDKRRTRWLESQGYRVLRFWNHDVLTNIDGVEVAIMLAVGLLTENGASEASNDGAAVSAMERLRKKARRLARAAGRAPSAQWFGQRKSHIVPSPLVGEGQGGGDCRTSRSGFPPPLAPPHKGEGNPRGARGKRRSPAMAELLLELFSEEIPARMQGRAAEDLRRLVTEGLKAQGLGGRRGQGVRDAAAAGAGGGGRAGEVAGHHRGAEGAARQRAGAGDRRVPQVGGAQVDQGGAGRQGREEGRLLRRKDRQAGPRGQGDRRRGGAGGGGASFPWPKSMRWGSGRTTWVRPLHSIVCLLDGKVVPFEIEGVESGNDDARASLPRQRAVRGDGRGRLRQGPRARTR